MFKTYDIGDHYDEMIIEQGKARLGAEPVVQKIQSLGEEELRQRQHAAEKTLFQQGVTFSLPGDHNEQEEIFPLDIIPRIVRSDEWERIDQGLQQRVLALNTFLNDIYNEQKILRDKIIPEELVFTAKGYRRQCIGLKPPRGIWCHITGSDLVRDPKGEFMVLEDNLRCPSGASYVLENRRVMKQTFPTAFDASSVQPVQAYPGRLLEMLRHIAPEEVPNPEVALLTPGPYNSAYFEHSYLAQQMGVTLVEGRDLVVIGGYVMMRTTSGLKRIDVLYRRVNDDFVDPLTFRKDSLLGVPGIMDVYRNGRIALANAPGTGVADDKAIYAFVPEIIKYYLGEDPILPNVPTYGCWKEKELNYVLNNLPKLVVKAVNESGGYGMLIGSYASRKELENFKERIKTSPRNYIAQPILDLSRAPVFLNGKLQGRHVDLRPFILHSKEIYVLPGGLTRVALKEGSLVVNSSQGGGSKDTWVVNTGSQVSC